MARWAGSGLDPFPATLGRFRSSAGESEVLVPRTRPPCPEEFRREAIRLATLGDKPQRQLAKDLGISDVTLRQGLKEEQGRPWRAPGLAESGRAQLIIVCGTGKTLAGIELLEPTAQRERPHTVHLRRSPSWVSAVNVCCLSNTAGDCSTGTASAPRCRQPDRTRPRKTRCLISRRVPICELRPALS
jgi:transposase-like protein